jgi:catechol 2,3-dioxygenase-like lactoylglutathione lyase family enzyme
MRWVKMTTTGAVLASALAGCIPFIPVAGLPMSPPAAAQDDPTTVEPVNHQPWMNVFRRFDAPSEEVFEFYGEVLGLDRLGSFSDVGAGGVHRFRAGAGELKLTQRVGDRSYVDGGVADATGLRLITLYFPDAEALNERFAAHGLPAPEWKPIPGTTRSAALVIDADGQPVELIAAPGEGEDVLKQVEVGLTVSDLEASRAFYRDFVGLEELPPVEDVTTGVTKHPFRHGSTTVSLRSYGAELPADTGGGGIQYVIRDAALVDRMAKERGVTIETPLNTLAGYALTTIWLNDPDGITNYFAQTGRPQAPAPLPEGAGE